MPPVAPPPASGAIAPAPAPVASTSPAPLPPLPPLSRVGLPPTSALLAGLGRALLRAIGWTVRFDGLPGPHGVVIVYPHTSNWDFPIGLLAKWALRVPLRWVAKDSLFRGVTGATLGRAMRAWGGRPVVRSQATGAVDALVRLIAEEPWCWVAITPEGTRSWRPAWRSGFYHLALRAGVPLGLATIDYATRCVRFTDFLMLTGDVAADMAEIRRRYDGVRGFAPRQQGPIVLAPPRDGRDDR